MSNNSDKILNNIYGIFKDYADCNEASNLAFDLVMETMCPYLMDVHSDGSSFLSGVFNSIYINKGSLSEDQMVLLFNAAEKTFESKKYKNNFSKLKQGESYGEDLIDFIFHFTYVVDENKIDLKGAKVFFTNVFLKALDSCSCKISNGYGRNELIKFIMENDEETRKLGFSWDVDDLKKIYDLISCSAQKSAFSVLLGFLDKSILYKKMSSEITNEVGSVKKVKV